MQANHYKIKNTKREGEKEMELTIGFWNIRWAIFYI